jgi:Ribbon-helix-helix protein, copG family
VGAASAAPTYSSGLSRPIDTHEGVSPDNPLGGRGSGGEGTLGRFPGRLYDDSVWAAPIRGAMPKISAVIPDDLGAALREQARVEDRSVGAVVRRAIAEHVRRPGDGQPTNAPARSVRDKERTE